MKELIIIRGPSGSGKSTLARHLNDVPGEHVGVLSSYYEADSFFVDPIYGGYCYDANLLRYAHSRCQSGVAWAMYHKIDRVIVSNTNTTMKELQTYLDLGAKFNYEIRVIRTPGPWVPEILFKRNVHDVPLEVLEKQIGRYTPYKDEEEWSDLSIYV